MVSQALAKSHTPEITPFRQGVPLLGLYPELRRDPLATLTDLARQGPVVRFRAGPMRFVLVSGPDEVEQVLVTRSKSYGKTTRGYDVLRLVLGNGLVTSQ